MKRITIMASCLAICIAALTGCSTQQEQETETTIENDTAIVGTWTEDYFDSGYTFNSDGTGRDTFWDLAFTYTAHDGSLTIDYDDETYADSVYTYSISDSAITLTRTTDEGETKSYTYTKS